MAYQSAWVEKAIQAAKKGKSGQDELIDYLLYDAILFGAIPMQVSSDDLQDIFEVLTYSDSVPLQELDAPLTEVTAETKVKQTNLQNFAAMMKVKQDKLRKLGFGKNAAEYFNSISPSVFRNTGGRLSKTIYDSLQAYAVANNGDTDLPSELQGTRVVNAGGSNDTNYSVVAVKWVPNETTGLYSDNGWGDGKVFDIEALYGGKTYLDDENIPSYATQVKLNLGLKLANPQLVTSVVNIDKGADLTSSGISLGDKLSEIIDEAHGADMLIMHPTLKRLLGSAYKGSFTQMRMNEKEINNIVDAWDDTMILTDRNLSRGAEANVTL